MMPRALIFDIGNVLLFHDNAVMWRKLAELFGRNEAEVQDAFSRDGLAAQTSRGLLTPEAMHAEYCRRLTACPDYAAFFESYCGHFRPNDAITALIERLAGRYRLLTLSNTNPVHVQYLREHLPILKQFDEVLLSSDLGIVKPERAIYEEAVRRSGVSAAECVYTDDLLPFVQAARASGLQALLFSDTATLERELAALRVT
ncbi:MAG: HAD family hydrolase [Dehalococcoidia bacterium]